MGKNGITYDMPPEPKFGTENGNGDMEIRMLDLRDDLDELTETVHNQWMQLCADDLKAKEEITEQTSRLQRLTIANLLTAGGLICVLITTLIS